MHWFTPHRIEGDLGEVIPSLVTVGIHFELFNCPTHYEVKREGGHEFVMKSIGRVEVADTGQIYALAFDHLSGGEIRCLLGAAERALAEVPSKATGWSRRQNKGRPRWECEVMIEVTGDEDDHAAVIARDVGLQERKWLAEESTGVLRWTVSCGTCDARALA